LGNALDPGNDAAFARRIGILPQTLHSYTKGRQSTPGGELLRKIVAATACSGHWLLTGEGEMFPKAEAELSLSEQSAPYEPNPGHGEALALEKARAEYWKNVAERYRQELSKVKGRRGP